LASNEVQKITENPHCIKLCGFFLVYTRPTGSIEIQVLLTVNMAVTAIVTADCCLELLS
jgi:hypothetical protein